MKTAIDNTFQWLNDRKLLPRYNSCILKTSAWTYAIAIAILVVIIIFVYPDS